MDNLNNLGGNGGSSYAAPLLSISMLLVASCVFGVVVFILVRQIKDTNTKQQAGRNILDTGRPGKAVAIKPVPGTPSDLKKSHKDLPTVPQYACWDDTLLTGEVLGTANVGPGEDFMKKCSRECHKRRACTHFELKDNKCIFKDRAVAYMDMMFRNFNNQSALRACGNGTRCADGYDKNRKVCLDPVMFQLDAAREGAPTNRQAMNNMVKMLGEAHKQANKSNLWNILSLVFLTAGLLFTPLSFVSGPLGAVMGVVDLTFFAADTAVGTVSTVKDIRDRSKFTKAMRDWSKTPYDIPVFVYHNLPKRDGNNLVWGYQCMQGAKLRATLCAENKDFGTNLAWNDADGLGVHYLKDGDKRTSVCCQPRKDAGESYGKCDDMFDPSDTGTCDFFSKEYKEAKDSTQRLLKSATWQNRPEAPNNYSNTLLSYVLKFGELIA